MIYALRIGWCALESVDTEIKHLDNWLIELIDNNSMSILIVTVIGIIFAM